MFTGIVNARAKVVSLQKSKAGWKISLIPFPPLTRVTIGSSIAVNGVCLTVVRKHGQKFIFDIVPETGKKTTLVTLKPGDYVNIESALRVGDELGGHLVQGHVDGIGVIKALKHENKEWRMTIKVSRILTRLMVAKGSIVIDGVSLTIADVKKNLCTVALIPYTRTHTTLGIRKIGDAVNIEVDIIAKYLKSKSS